MGKVRSHDFDAVIGREPEGYRIVGKVNWIGIGAHKQQIAGRRGPLVTFDHFVLFEDQGANFRKLAPMLAGRMYSRKRQTLGPLRRS